METTLGINFEKAFVNGVEEILVGQEDGWGCLQATKNRRCQYLKISKSNIQNSTLAMLRLT
jgi:hypothetical protein